MDEPISRSVQSLLQTVQRSGIYRNYKKEEARLMKNEELWKRVSRFRADNYRLQNDANADLFQGAEKLYRESTDLRSIPEVNAYLDAELALCRLVQEIFLDITDGIDVHTPRL